MANRTLTTLTAVLQMNNSKFKKGLTGSQKALKGFQKQVKAVGGMIAGAFAVSAIVSFGREAVQLAAKMQGVQSAFDKLNDPNLLSNLRAATRGMVSDLELMRQAVRAQNFAIPLEDLATYFEFATKRSIETGESVDYLVNSIIDGIGRKSTLVMDNLGISSVALQNEIKKTGDFAIAAGNLIKQGIGEMGEVADTAIVKMVAAQATWDNFKAKAGEKILTVAANNITDFRARLELLGNDGVDILTKLWAATSGEMDAVISLAEQWREYNKAMEKTPVVVKDIVWQYREGIESGIDWLKVNKEIYDQWLKENAIIQQQIALKQSLLDINTKLRQDAEARLKALGETAETFAPVQETGDMWGALTDNDEVFEGTEAWEKYAEGIEGADTAATNLGKTIGMTLANQFGQLGEAVGKFVRGAEGAFADLGNMIAQNLGNILMMAGFSTANWGLVAAGAAIQFGGGLLRGLGSTAPSGQGANSSGTVDFRISGNDLVGALQRNNVRNSLVT